MKIVFIIVGIAILFLLLRSIRSRKIILPDLPSDIEHDLLLEHVRFYRGLNAAGRLSFRSRMAQFLAGVPITPVGDVEVTALDRLYVAAAAIIPIFSYADWAYNNLDEVLLYPGAFTKDFTGKEGERNVLGMVGDGAMHRMMIFSQGALRAGFEEDSAGNTGIHEFVHLLDKADGAVDGVPEAMMPEGLREQWLDNLHHAIAAIRSGESGINPYAGTNDAEAFAVISEYFFQKPEVLKMQHPELWAMLEKIYK